MTTAHNPRPCVDRFGQHGWTCIRCGQPLVFYGDTDGNGPCNPKPPAESCSDAPKL
jgi:hypothetical protein